MATLGDVIKEGEGIAGFEDLRIALEGVAYPGQGQDQTELLVWMHCVAIATTNRHCTEGWTPVWDWKPKQQGDTVLMKMMDRHGVVTIVPAYWDDGRWVYFDTRDDMRLKWVPCPLCIKEVE